MICRLHFALTLLISYILFYDILFFDKISSLLLGVIVASFSSIPDYDWRIYAWSNRQLIKLKGSPLKYVLFPYYLFLKLINKVFKHRTTTHSLFFVGIFFLFGYFLLKLFYLIGLAIFLHIIEDCFTVSGVPIFYPLSNKALKIPVINTRKHLREQKLLSYAAIGLLIFLLVSS